MLSFSLLSMLRPISPSTSAVAFIATSLFASLIGRLVVTRFFFDYPVVILLLQNATILFFVEVLRVLNVIKLAPYSFERGRHVFLASFLFCVAQWLTVASFEGIGLPVFDAVKRFTPLAIVAVSTVFHRQGRIEKGIYGSVLAISVISFFTINLEITVDRFSLFYGVIAACLQAIAYVQFEHLSQNFPAMEMLYLHSFNSLLVFLLADVVQDEIRDAFMYMMTSAHPLFTFVFVVLLLSALPLQFATFLSIEMNGALNTQIISNVRSCVQIFIAYFLSLYLFYDVSPSLVNYLGLLAILPATYYYIQTVCARSDIKMPWVVKA